MATITYLLFPLGQIVMTPAAAQALRKSGETPWKYLRKHVALDQGELDNHDHAANVWSVKNEGRILSRYQLASGEKLWIITEWDRSYTTCLLPSDY